MSKSEPAAAFERPASEWAAVDSPAPDELLAAGYPEWQAGLLARRGILTPAAAERFFSPALEQLHDPLLLAGMEAAVDRLETAIEAGAKVAIVGDYDVDGVSATALLTAVFGACGLEVEAILPHRLSEGYGFQPLHVERARAAGCTLIVTADCGTTSHLAAEAAAEAGIDVVVTDHHLLEGEPPRDVVLVNPKQPGCSYPFDELCGVGLAFKLATALAERRGVAIDPLRLLRIACLGTICDLVPLRGENRVIAALGLGALPASPSVGLKALIKVSGVRGAVSATDIGYRLGPRINAAGRMDSPQPALDLLLERDPARAARLAAGLDELNRSRQAVERAVVDEARERLAERGTLPPILVAWDPGWHRGVLGIAAGRLAKEFHRPTLLLELDGEAATGSGRSVRGIHLHRFLARWSSELERFGGHAQAVGLTIGAGRLERLRDEWEEAAAEWDESLLVPRYRYDGHLAAEDVSRELIDALARFEPFGQANPRPLWRVGPLAHGRAPRRFGDNNVELTAAGESGGLLAVVGWGWGERVEELGDSFECLGTLAIDSYWNRPVLRLLDARPLAPRTAPRRVQ